MLFADARSPALHRKMRRLKSQSKLWSLKLQHDTFVMPDQKPKASFELQKPRNASNLRFFFVLFVLFVLFVSSCLRGE